MLGCEVCNRGRVYLRLKCFCRGVGLIQGGHLASRRLMYRFCRIPMHLAAMASCSLGQLGYPPCRC